MHVGLSLSFQNLVPGQSDADVYQHELSLARGAEAAGFDSVWTPEHHFTDYMLTPNVPQFLSWLAGQTSSIKLGTMVTVLPWHDPVRAAESFVLLDHLSGGRAIAGIGRGLGRVEFDGFRLDMNHSRTQFREYAEAILTALESGEMAFDGEVYKQPSVQIRPAPLKSFKGRTFASAISPDSVDILARLGTGLMIFAQKPWDTVKDDLDRYRARYFEVNGFEAPRPVMCTCVAVSEDAAEAQAMRDKYIFAYARSTVAHYEFDNVEFANIKGYEYYAGLAKNINKHGLDKFNQFLADLHVAGSPEQVADRLIELSERLELGGLLVSFSYGGMPHDLALRNQQLFVEKVMPRLKAHDVGGDIGVCYEAADTAKERVSAHAL